MDVFLSYRNTPERRAYVERLRLVLDAYGLDVWWDYGLEAGKNYEPQIMAELASAGVVIPLWCAQSIASSWVAKEARYGLDAGKLLPARLQAVVPPDPFEPIQAQDLVGWDGAVESYQITALAAAICGNLGKALAPAADKLRALRALTLLAPLSQGLPPGVVPAGPAPSPAAQAWAHVEASLDPRAYDDFIADYPGTVELTLARRNKRMLADWAGVDKADPAALAAFRTGLLGGGFAALERHSERVGDQAQRAVQEREEAWRLIEATARHRAAEAASLAHEGHRERHLRAAAAARAGRPVAERSFMVELPGVRGWPNPQMMAIPPGRFLMGSPRSEERGKIYDGQEEPQHEVRIEHVFALGRHAVTFAEWDAAVAAGAQLETPGDRGWGRGTRPVIYVAWDDAQAYIAWLNMQAGLTGRPDAYRLPSEAEWEYACRAGTTTPFHFGETISTAQANYDGNFTYGNGVKGEYRKQTLPVGSFPSNAFGLHEMHGNVFEWCEDFWHQSYVGAPADGSACPRGGVAFRVVRGGFWNLNPLGLRSANRHGRHPDIRNSGQGFRLARTVSPSER